MGTDVGTKGLPLEPLEVPAPGLLAQVQQVWTPNLLRRYEGAAHAERCSRPATWQLTTTKALDGDLDVAGYGAGACIALLRTGAVLHVASLLDISFLYIELMRDSLVGGPPARWFVIFNIQHMHTLHTLERTPPPACRGENGVQPGG